MTEQLISLRNDFRCKMRLEAEARKKEDSVAKEEKEAAKAHAESKKRMEEMDKTFDFLTAQTKAETARKDAFGNKLPPAMPTGARIRD